jgi:hypothetical protein
MSDETEQTAKALQYCAKSVDAWLASGANETKIPRAQIAVLSTWVKESCQSALASQPKPATVLLTDDECREVDQFLPLRSIRAIESAVLRKNGWGV